MYTIKTSHVSMLALAGILAVAAFSTEAADVKVNGVTIPQSRFDLLFKQATMRGQQQDTPELRNAIRDHLIESEIISQEVVNKGLDKNPDVAAALDMEKQQQLIQIFAQDYIKNHPVTEDMMKQEYERQKAQLADKKEYKVRHILVKTQAEAQNIIDQLKKGSSFEKLAKEKSVDAGSKSKGGDIGWIAPGQTVPQFSDAIVKLKKGGVSEMPVQTQYGWHVIRVDDIRPAKIPSYDEAKPQLKQILENTSLKKEVDDLRAKAKIEQ